jgi:hypothetical protein
VGACLDESVSDPKRTLAAEFAVMHNRCKFDLNQSAANPLFALLMGRVLSPKGFRMRAPSERDQCQAKLNTLIEGFMQDDWAGYRDALQWLRDFADQKNVERGRVMCGSYWYSHR